MNKRQRRKYYEMREKRKYRAHKGHGRNGYCVCFEEEKAAALTRGDSDPPGLYFGSYECAKAGCPVCKTASAAASRQYAVWERGLKCFEEGCGRPIDWRYAPMSDNGPHGYCEEHIPRGCSCTVNYREYDEAGEGIGTPVYSKDSQGRDMPCVEFDRVDQTPPPKVRRKHQRRAWLPYWRSSC